MRQFEELLQDLKVRVVLSEIGSGGSFTERSVGVRVISIYLYIIGNALAELVYRFP